MRVFVTSLILFISSIATVDAQQRQVVESSKAAIALIDTRAYRQSGTAFCIDRSGLFVTSLRAVKHLRSDDELNLLLNVGSERQTDVKAVVIRTDTKSDLALLKTEGEGNFHALPLGDDAEVFETMETLVFGFPNETGRLNGRAVSSNQPPALSVRVGRVTSIYTQDSSGRFALDIHLKRGSYGAPVLDKSGKVIGVVGAGDVADRSHGIPVSELLRLIARPETSVDVPDDFADRPGQFHPVSVEVQPLLSAATDFSVEASLRINQGESQKIILKKNGDSKFTGSFVPISNYRPHERLIEAQITYPGGEVNAPVINQEFSVDSLNRSLMDVRRLIAKDDGTHQVMFVDGSEVSGRLNGLDQVRVNFGNVTSEINLSKADTVTLHLLEIRLEGEFTFTVRQSGEVVDQLVHRTSSFARDPIPTTKLNYREKRVLPMPGVITDIVVAGGGSRILAVMSHLKEIAVIGAASGSVIKILPLSSDNVLVVGTLNHILVFDRAKHLVERWSLNSLRRETTVENPVSGTVGMAAAGYASAGPVLVFSNANSPSAKFSTLETLSLQSQAVQSIARRPALSPDQTHRLRASANGAIFGMWSTSQRPQGISCLRLKHGRLDIAYEHKSAGYVCPGPYGMNLFTRTGGLYSNTLTARSRGPSPPSIPTTHPKFYVVLSNAIGAQQKIGETEMLYDRSSVRMVGANTSLVDLPDLELGPEPLQNEQQTSGLSLDQRVFYFVQADSLVTVPFSNDRVIVQHFSMETELEKQSVDYFYVASMPPRAFAPGKEYRYQIRVASSDPEVTYELASGPDYMEISSSGELTWTVPSDFREKSVDVIVTLSNGSRQTRYDSFTLYANP